jgi:two-component system CheB/CheR fusion protein
MAEGLPAPEDDLEALLFYLREARSFDFTGYKRASLTRRIRHRMQEVGIAEFESYKELLEAEPEEFTNLFNTILINVTGFLRDRDAWDYLTDSVIPRILSTKTEDRPVRVWSAGCASGEETYSLAVLLCDAVGEDRFRRVVKIYGTDADEESLAQARRASYPAQAVIESFGVERVSRYFEPENGTVVFRPDLRRAIIFGRHDLVRDPPISRVDLLVCRNTLMYFNADTQRDILSSFHFALNEGGFLFLGKSEALVVRTNLFAVDDLRHHLFSKERSDLTQAPVAQLATPAPLRPAEPSLAAMAFDHGPQAQVVVDGKGDLVLANLRARNLLGMGPTHIGRSLRDLQISYRPAELRGSLDKVLEERRPQTITNIEHHLPSGSKEHLEVQLQPLMMNNSLVGVHITFAEVGRYRQLQEELARSQSELEAAYEELQSAVEELETTNEELQSTNEELETTNEELQSTNEELETMNEELQSTNEELETMNNALRERSSEMDELNSFLQAIVNSLDCGIAVLSPDMSVRLWNGQSQDLWGLRADEVKGQHFLNLDIGLPVGQLHQPIKDCLSGQSSGELRELDAVNRRGRPLRCQVCIYPLKGSTSAGAIILMQAEEAPQAAGTPLEDDRGPGKGR